MTLIDTDQNEHGCIFMANGAEKPNSSQTILGSVRFFPANPVRRNHLSRSLALRAAIMQSSSCMPKALGCANSRNLIRCAPSAGC